MRNWLKWVIHNCAAHPLLVLFPPVGLWVHDLTIVDRVEKEAENHATPV
jgi:hypothetical protein